MSQFRFSKGMWDHERFSDVYMEVIKVQYRGTKYTKMRVTWWHRNGYPLTAGCKQTVKIYKKDYFKWKLVC